MQGSCESGMPAARARVVLLYIVCEIVMRRRRWGIYQGGGQVELPRAWFARLSALESIPVRLGISPSR